MILTDDDFATIVKAVELGPGALRQPAPLRPVPDDLSVRVHRTFLGGDIFNILGGIPFLPLKTLSISSPRTSPGDRLGYGKPREGLMDEKLRAPGRPPPAAAVVPVARGRRPLDGLRDARRHRPDEPPRRRSAHTMGLTTFSLFHLFYPLETTNASRTLFTASSSRPGPPPDRRLSVLTISFATSFGPLQRLLQTTDLTIKRWTICVPARPRSS